MKRFVILLFLILIICGGSYLVFSLSKNDKPITVYGSEIKNTEPVEDKNDEILQGTESATSESSEINTTISSTQSIEKTTEPKKKVDSNNSTTTTKKIATTKKIVTTQEVKEVTTTQKTTTKKKEKWEKLGVTEDEYYNKPAFKWEKVDFSVEKYGSESAARKACLNYGDNYKPYLDGEVAFNCDSVHSLSGRYLGEMFYTEKLQ